MHPPTPLFLEWMISVNRPLRLSRYRAWRRVANAATYASIVVGLVAVLALRFGA